MKKISTAPMNKVFYQTVEELYKIYEDNDIVHSHRQFNDMHLMSHSYFQDSKARNAKINSCFLENLVSSVVPLIISGEISNRDAKRLHGLFDTLLKIRNDLLVLNVLNNIQ